MGGGAKRGRLCWNLHTIGQIENRGRLRIARGAIDKPVAGRSDAVGVANAPFLLPCQHLRQGAPVLIDRRPCLLPIINIEQERCVVQAGRAPLPQEILHQPRMGARLDYVDEIGLAQGKFA